MLLATIHNSENQILILISINYVFSSCIKYSHFRVETNFDEMTKIYSIERNYFFMEMKIWIVLCMKQQRLLCLKARKFVFIECQRKKLPPNTLYSAMISFQLEMMWVHWKKNRALFVQSLVQSISHKFMQSNIKQWLTSTSVEKLFFKHGLFE